MSQSIYGLIAGVRHLPDIIFEDKRLKRQFKFPNPSPFLTPELNPCKNNKFPSSKAIEEQRIGCSKDVTMPS
jgi:hypothetical protein